MVGVSATGSTTQDTSAGQYVDNLKSFYSSYGVSAVDVTAPGGDSVFFSTPTSPEGRVLSTWPDDIACPPGRSRQEPTRTRVIRWRSTATTRARWRARMPPVWRR